MDFGASIFVYVHLIYNAQPRAILIEAMASNHQEPRGDRVAMRANSEALPWEPVPEGLRGPEVGDFGMRYALWNEI